MCIADSVVFNDSLDQLCAKYSTNNRVTFIYKDVDTILLQESECY